MSGFDDLDTEEQKEEFVMQEMREQEEEEENGIEETQVLDSLDNSDETIDGGVVNQVSKVTHNPRKLERVPLMVVLRPHA